MKLWLKHLEDQTDLSLPKLFDIQKCLRSRIM